MEQLRKGQKLNIRHKAFSRFYALDGVFIHIQAQKLQGIRKLPLGFPGGLAVMRDLPAADVVPAVTCLVNKYIRTPF